MVAGRNASGMASELGSMIVTEQIDAMRALGTDPDEEAGDAACGRHRVHAVFPDHHFRPARTGGRQHGLAACCWAWTRASTGPRPGRSLVFRDVFTGLIKPVLFGFIISTVGCYYGMSTRGGTQGVGRATTQAVVASSVLILVVDFFVTKLLMALCSGTDRRCQLPRFRIEQLTAPAAKQPGGDAIALRECVSSHSTTRPCSTASPSSCRTGKPRLFSASPVRARARS